MDEVKTRFLVAITVLFSGLYEVQGDDNNTCFSDTSHPCWCDFKSFGKRIDITYLESYQPTVEKDSFFFTYDPCHDFQCNSATSDVRICMSYKGTEVGIGRLTDYYKAYWTLYSLDPLKFTIHYYHGDKFPLAPTQSTVTFVSGEKIKLSFTYYSNISQLFEFELKTPNVYVKDIPPVEHKREWIAGVVVVIWLLLVAVVAVIVIAIVYINIKHYRKKFSTESQYDPLPSSNTPSISDNT